MTPVEPWLLWVDSHEPHDLMCLFIVLLDIQKAMLFTEHPETSGQVGGEYLAKGQQLPCKDTP